MHMTVNDTVDDLVVLNLDSDGPWPCKFPVQSLCQHPQLNVGLGAHFALQWSNGDFRNLGLSAHAVLLQDVLLPLLEFRGGRGLVLDGGTFRLSQGS